MNQLFHNWWVREITSILFKLHPIILLAFNQLDSGETFLTLVVSYLIMALFYSVRMVHAIGYHLFIIQFPKQPRILAKSGSVFGHTIGILILLFIHLFVYLIFFGLLFDAVERPMYPDSVFDGAAGQVLIRTLLINGIWFFTIELLSFIRHVRNHTPERNNVGASIFWGVDFMEKNRWRNIRIFWLMLFFMFFILMCTGFAFHLAIGSFFVFDIGYIFFHRMQLRGKQVVPASTDPAFHSSRRINP